MTQTNYQSLTTRLPVTAVQGGTGLNAYTAGDMIFASDTDTFAKLPGNNDSNAYVLGYDYISSGSAPEWLQRGDLTEISSAVLTITNGEKAILGASGLQIAVNQATALQSGYLSNTDFSTFATASSTVSAYLNQSVKTTASPTFVAVTADEFTGDLIGNADTASIASIAEKISLELVTDNAPYLITYFNTSGSAFFDGDITYNPSTKTLATTNFVGTNFAGKINNLTVTAPASSSTLTIANMSSFTTVGAFPIVLTFAASTTVTFPTSGTLVNSDVVALSALSTVGTLTSAIWNATPISEIYGGTNQNSYTLGDILYSSASNTLSKLSGNTTITKKYLSQTGNGTISGAPAWAQIAAIDLSNGTTGTGSVVLASSPTLITPTLGVANATTLNKVTVTAPATGSTLTIANGKTFTVNNTLTLSGTDGSSVAFGGGGTVAYQGGTLAQFSATTSAQLAGIISDETGNGPLVFGTSPTLTTPTIAGAVTQTSTALAVWTINQNNATPFYTGLTLQRQASEYWFSGMDNADNSYIFRRSGTTNDAGISPGGVLWASTQMVIGGGAKPTIGNSACALDIQGTTRALKHAVMTTTQKLALTALQGMEIFDSTLLKLCVYTGSAWQTVAAA